MFTKEDLLNIKLSLLMTLKQSDKEEVIDTLYLLKNKVNEELQELEKPIVAEKAK